MEKIFAQLIAPEGVVRSHKKDLSRIYGGYCVANVDLENPGTHARVMVKARDQRDYTVLLEAKDLPGAKAREIFFYEDNVEALKAFEFFQGKEGVQVLKTWEAVIAK